MTKAKAATMEAQRSAITVLSSTMLLPQIGFLPLVFACSSCGPTVTVVEKDETCSAASLWQLDFPSKTGGPTVHDIASRQGIYGAVGAHEEGTLQKTGVVSVDSDGNTLWQTTVSARQALLVDIPDGFVVAGEVYQNNLYHTEITRLGTNGSSLFTVSVGDYTEGFLGAIVSHENNLYAVSTVSVNSEASDANVSKLSTNGVVAWSRVYGLTGYNEERIRGVAVGHDGHLVVGTQRWKNGGGGPPWIFKLDDNGTITAEYLDTVTHDRGGGFSFLTLRSGGFLVAGTVYAKDGFSSGPARIVRLKDTLEPEWIVSLDDGSDFQQLINAGVELANGDIVLAGHFAKNGLPHAWKINRDGKLQWSRDYAEPVGYIEQVHVVPDGGLVFLARKTDYDDSMGTFQIIRMNENGDVSWIHETSHEGLAQRGDIIIDERGMFVLAAAFSHQDTKHGRLLGIEEVCRP